MTIKAIGFDFDGQVHLRIEHRVVPAGPTIKDCIANAAFYFGLVRGFGLAQQAPEESLPFQVASDNFYTAARFGLNAQLRWFREGALREVGVRELIMDELLPMAHRGLETANIPAAEIDDYLNVIAERVDSGQNGAAWQKRWVQLHGNDLHQLVREYRQRQDAGQPVHRWNF